MTHLIIINLIGIAVMLFNLFVCSKILTNNIEKKTIRIAIVLLVNLPTLVYSDVWGFSFNFFQFQVFGYGNDIARIGFKLIFDGQQQGQSHHFVFVSLPIGALYAYYKFDTWLRDKEYADEGI